MIRRICLPAVVVVLIMTVEALADPTYDRVQLMQGNQLVHFMAANDFDGDGNLDVAVSGIFPPYTLTVAFGDGLGGFQDTLTIDAGTYDRLTSGFVDADAYPDIIGLRWSTQEVGVFLSNGDRTFASPIEFTAGAIYPWSMVTGYVDDDANLDLVLAGWKFELYTGDGAGNFTLVDTLIDGRSGKGASLLDLDHDGINDLCAVGGDWVWFALADGQGGFTVTDSTYMDDPFASQFSHGHDVIDFDEDGNPDVLVADFVAAIDGDSHARVIMSDGSGHIKDVLSIAVPQSLHGMTAFDFNNDNHLDLAAGSTADKRLHIYLGDGTGGIADSFSISTAPILPTCLVAGDFLEDGNWDIVMGDVGTGSSVFIRTDQEAMSLLGGEMTTTAPAKVGLRIENPDALLVDELRYHVAGARCDFRDADGDGAVDQRVTDANVRAGAYRVSVWGTAASGSTLLDLPVTLGGKEYVLAQGATAPAVGDTVHFAVYAGAGTGVFPPSGGIAGEIPTFDWSNVVSNKSNATVYGFQLSDSWDFSTPLYDVNDLSVPQFTPPAALDVETMYYWRYRSGDGTTWDDYSDLHALSVTSCSCPFQADMDGDGFLTALDLYAIVDVLFAGHQDVQDPACPVTRADFDNDGFSTVLDLAKVIEHLFVGAAAPCDPCNPISSLCAK